MDFANIALPIIEALVVSGGLVTIFTLRQTKEAKKLDNAQKLCDEYTELLEKYKARSAEQDSLIESLKEHNNELVKRYESRIADREAQYQEHIKIIESNYQKQIAEMEAALAKERENHSLEIESLKKSIASLKGQLTVMKKAKK